MTSLKDLAMKEASKAAWGFLLARRTELKNFLSVLFTRFGRVDILEVGCFKGMLLGWLEQEFPRDRFSWSYVGVDIVEPSDRRRDYRHLVMNAEALEFPPCSFHAVIMIEVLEHVVDYVKALREAFRVLKPGGGIFIQSVICTDPAAVSDETHFHVLHPRTLSRLLRWIGFRDVHFVEGSNFAVWGFR